MERDRVPDSAPTPRIPHMDVETLRNPRDYPYPQLAEACYIAGVCKQVFGTVRFIYAQEPREHA